jgi:hypothetical protein
VNFSFAQGDRNAHNLTFTGLIDPHGQQNGCISNLTVLPDWRVQGIQIEITTCSQRPLPPTLQHLIQLGGGPADLAGGDLVGVYVVSVGKFTVSLT